MWSCPARLPETLQWAGGSRFGGSEDLILPSPFPWFGRLNSLLTTLEPFGVRVHQSLTKS